MVNRYMSKPGAAGSIRLAISEILVRLQENTS